MERFEINDNQFVKKNIISSLPDKSLPEPITSLLEKWNSGTVKGQNGKYHEIIDGNDVENNWHKCSKVNHYLCQTYQNVIKNKNYLQLIVDFLNVGDVLYALTIADIVLQVARKSQTLPKASNVDRSKIDTFISSLDDLRYKIEHDKDLIQNVKRDDQLDEDLKNRLENTRNAINKELIYKIDGATALAKEIGTDQFIQFAIDQSYFFEPGIVQKQMEEIVKAFTAKDGNNPAPKELYARRSTKEWADEENPDQANNEGNITQGKNKTYNQKIDYVRTACAPIKIIADGVIEQADKAYEASKKASEYVSLVEKVVDAYIKTDAAKNAVKNATNAAPKNAEKKNVAAKNAIEKAKDAIEKAKNTITVHQAVNAEEIKAATIDTAIEAIDTSKNDNTLNVSIAAKNVGEAAKTIKDVATAIINAIKKSTRVAADVVENAKEKVSNTANNVADLIRELGCEADQNINEVQQCASAALDQAEEAVVNARKIVKEIRSVSANLDVSDATEWAEKVAKNAELLAKAIRQTDEGQQKDLLQATEGLLIVAASKLKSKLASQKNAEMASQAARYADILKKAVVEKPEGEVVDQENPTEEGDSKIKKKAAKYCFFYSTEVKTFVNEIIVDYPIIIDNDGNAQVRSLITDATGYLVGAGKDNIFQNYRISHVWGRAFDPRYFTNLWNIVIVPSWANDLLDKPNAIKGSLESKLQSTIMKICELLYFNENCVKTEHVKELNMPGYPQVINEGDAISSTSEISIPVNTTTLKDTSAKDNTKPYLINIIKGKGNKTLGDIVKYAVYI